MKIYNVLIETDCGPVPARVVKHHDHIAALEAALKEKDAKWEARNRDAMEYVDQINELRRILADTDEKNANLAAENKELRQRLDAHGDIQTDEEEKEAEELCMGCSTVPFICPDCKFIPIKKEAEDGGDV